MYNKMDRVTKFVKVLENQNLKEIKTLSGVVMFTIKLCKKVYKSRCNKELIKASISLVVEKLNNSNKLPEDFDRIINSVSEKEVNDLIDDLYESYHCLRGLFSMSCKKSKVTNPVQDPVENTYANESILVTNKELNVEVSEV